MGELNKECQGKYPSPENISLEITSRFVPLQNVQYNVLYKEAKN